jgi:GPN-loop GTPase 3 homolog CNB04680/CNBB1090
MVSFLPLDLSNEESLNLILSCIDNILQYGEDEEPIEPKDIEQEESDLT